MERYGPTVRPWAPLLPFYPGVNFTARNFLPWALTNQWYHSICKLNLFLNSSESGYKSINYGIDSVIHVKEIPFTANCIIDVYAMYNSRIRYFREISYRIIQGQECIERTQGIGSQLQVQQWNKKFVFKSVEGKKEILVHAITSKKSKIQGSATGIKGLKCS